MKLKWDETVRGASGKTVWDLKVEVDGNTMEVESFLDRIEKNPERLWAYEYVMGKRR